MKAPALVYSLADQHFERTKSVGILNVSLGLLGGLMRSPALGRLTVLANRTLPLPAQRPEAMEVKHYDLAIGGRLGRLLWDQWRVYTVAAQVKADWLVLPKGFASFLRRSPLALAAYVHDTIPLHYQERYAGAYPAGEAWYFSQCFAATMRQAKVVLTNTETSRQAIMEAARRRNLPVPAVVVAGIGFEEGPLLFTHKADRIVCLASPWPHKLTGQAVEFLERWRRQADYRGTIELVGRLPKGLEPPEASAWRWHDRLPEAQYKELLGSARALVYFSEMEGFGMPPVEAVLAGTCPVYSDVPAHREVMAGCGCSFTNGDYQSFARALELACAMPAEQLHLWRTALLARHNWGVVTARVIGALINIRGQG